MRKLLTLLALLSAMATTAQTSDVELKRLHERTDAYRDSCERQPDWLLSRLQMYWTTHATDVFINGESFSHPGGERADYATVKYNGSRGMATAYDRPRLEDIVPYDDDDQGSVTFVSRQTGRMERVHPSKTGCQIATLNRQVVGVARDAARLYVLTGDASYARMAFGVFDTFVKGIYYRHVPTDLNHGHQQTLVGMTTFEVIHEDAINELTEMYTLLDGYAPFREGCQLYDAAMKKWAENIIAGGVPHNNWDLIQATFIMRIALVLQPDADYADHRGREYYLDYVLHQSSIRQWSMSRLADYGFDPQTAIWCESPGYSTGVVADFVSFACTMDEQAGIDMLSELPVIVDAVFAQPQYLFPNRMICGFGDTHPGYLKRQPVEQLLRYARRHGNEQLAARCDDLLRAIAPDAPEQLIGRYVSPTFYSPNVSWLVHRTGMDRERSLMVSLNASLGNHQHANGISMELYGRGYVLAPDAGIGRSLYSGFDYQEYYSQFPAHNTVCVDGVSSYPVMMSQHAFSVDMLKASDGLSVSQVSFVEPETQADQLRTVGIVGTPQGGYYVDIFRSRRRDGRDKFHDYFYHNMGQTMTLSAADGTSLPLQPTDELAFAGGHLYAYSYIYDKKSAATDKDLRADYTMRWPDGRRHVDMTMWMRGSEGRTVFQALSPVNLEYERLGDYFPYKVDEQPVLTFVARQQGEAWTRPFIAVFEPSDQAKAPEIRSVEYFTPSGRDAVGIKVTTTSGRTDYIFSAPAKTVMKHEGMTVEAAYAVVTDGRLVFSASE